MRDPLRDARIVRFTRGQPIGLVRVHASEVSRRCAIHDLRMPSASRDHKRDKRDEGDDGEYVLTVLGGH